MLSDFFSCIYSVTLFSSILSLVSQTHNPCPKILQPLNKNLPIKNYRQNFAP